MCQQRGDFNDFMGGFIFVHLYDDGGPPYVLGGGVLCLSCGTLKIFGGGHYRVGMFWNFGRKKNNTEVRKAAGWVENKKERVAGGS